MPDLSESFLSYIKGQAIKEIDAHTVSDTFPAIGPNVILKAEKVIEWVDYTRHLKELALSVSSDKQRLHKVLKDTQYLSTIWIKTLTDLIPEDARPEALKSITRAVVAGMKNAGMEEYKGEHLT